MIANLMVFVAWSHGELGWQSNSWSHVIEQKCQIGMHVHHANCACIILSLWVAGKEPCTAVNAGLQIS